MHVVANVSSQVLYQIGLSFTLERFTSVFQYAFCIEQELERFEWCT